MLSKIARNALRAAFSKVTTTSSSTSILSQVTPTTKTESLQVQPETSTNLKEVNEISSLENLHFNDYINGVKSQVIDELSINFQDLNHQQVLVLDSPVGDNNWKLAQLITLGGAFKFLGLLAGFPSYLALVGSLGVTGIGAALSYSNYLRRSAPQITGIKLTKQGKYHILYLKPGFLARQESDFEVDAKNFSFASFGCQYKNYLRKCNNTSWVSVEGNLFWFNNDQNSVRTNSHLYHKLF